jgi:hypothetical protein
MSTDPLAERIATAGVGLGALGIQWGRRPASPRPCQITDRDLRVLAFVHDFNYATTTTLAALFWGRLGTAAQERLKLLHDVGFLDRLRPRVSRTQGSCEWIYRLTDRGWRTLVDTGTAADGLDYTPAELTSISYVEHDIQVAALVTRLAALAARTWGREGPLIDAAPFRLVGPRAGTIDPRYEERAPERSERAATWPLAHDVAAPGVLKPDATLVWEAEGVARLAVMVEFDRTRRATKQLRRLRRYDWFISEGWTQSRYATLLSEPVLLVVCADERQLQPFAQAADTHLNAWLHDRLGATRDDAPHPGREQIGFTTRERLMTGNWQLLQVTPAPQPDWDRSKRRTGVWFTFDLTRVGRAEVGR